MANTAYNSATSALHAFSGAALAPKAPSLDLLPALSIFRVALDELKAHGWNRDDVRAYLGDLAADVI